MDSELHGPNSNSALSRCEHSVGMAVVHDWVEWPVHDDDHGHVATSSTSRRVHGRNARNAWKSC